MWYIKEQPNNGGNHGNPMGQQFSGSVELPDALLSEYVAVRGFVYLTVENSVVVALKANTEALAAYLAEHPDAEQEEPVDELAAAVERGMTV